MSQLTASALAEHVDRIIDGYGADQQFSLAILQDIQKTYNYLSREALEQTAKRLQLSQSEVFRLATFFSAFSLEPKGVFAIKVCLGTACHVRGGSRILETLERELGITSGHTTPDGKFSLDAVRCLGACALAPVVVVNEEPYASLTPDKVTRLISQLGSGEAEQAEASVDRAGVLPGEPAARVESEAEHAASGMPILGTLEDLVRLEEQFREEILARDQASTKITIGMGTCGISAGARAVRQAVLAECDARNIDARVTAVGCIGMCWREPLVDIQQGNQPRITYANVTPEMVSRIIEEHVVGGRLVEDWIVGRLATRREEAT